MKNVKNLALAALNNSTPCSAEFLSPDAHKPLRGSIPGSERTKQIYQALATLYGKDEVMRVWGQATAATVALFRDVTREQFDHGFNTALERGDRFAPKPGEFRAWCLAPRPPRPEFVVPRLPESEEARRERIAKNYAECKPYIDECRRVLGL